jgi:hypothetical protein
VAYPAKVVQEGSPEFVNREQDLSLLLGLLPPRHPGSSLIILKAPSGFGKTRLTSRIIEILQSAGVFAVALEPQVRAKSVAHSVYQGFYLQRCAQALDHALKASPGTSSAPDFGTFLKTDRFRRAKAVDLKAAVRQPPGVRAAYHLALELLDRILNTGDHSAKKQLTSDSREAIDTCGRYIRSVVEVMPLVLVVREAQHIDQLSLNFLSDVAGPQTQHSVMLEYTLDTPTGDFNQPFVDLIETASLQDARWLHIVELFRLSKPHLQRLLRLTVPDAGEVTGEYYQSWDGNVRVVRQLRFSLSTKRMLDAPLQLQSLKSGAVSQYRVQIQQLTSTGRFALCLLFVHGEAMPRALLGLSLEKLSVLATKGVVEELIETEFVAIHEGDLLGLDNEDVAEAVRTDLPLAGNLLLARRVLRDYYQGAVANVSTQPHVSFALRQALRFSVELGDMATVEEVISHLSAGVTESADQSWYVAQIAAAVGGRNAELFADQRDRLLLWAAELAYAISDFRKARNLLRQLSSKSAFSDALLCACCMETGDHGEAAALAEQLIMRTNVDERFVGRLADLILLRCTGQIDKARVLWGELHAHPSVGELKLYGYLLRFKELVVDFPDCNDALRASVEWFLERGLRSSAAYSELTLAGDVARQGEEGAAAAAVSRAKELLAPTPRDQHILLNNDVAVSLLSSRANPAECCDKLVRAIPCSGDDYSDLVLYTNLAIAATLADRRELASESISRGIRIAAKPRFADRDVFWGVSFNMRFADSRLTLAFGAELDRLFTELKPHSLQNDYWQYRMGHASSVPERFHHMLTKPYHPMFLSHWAIDVDGLRALK